MGGACPTKTLLAQSRKLRLTRPRRSSSTTPEPPDAAASAFQLSTTCSQSIPRTSLNRLLHLTIITNARKRRTTSYNLRGSIRTDQDLKLHLPSISYYFTLYLREVAVIPTTLLDGEKSDSRARMQNNTLPLSSYSLIDVAQARCPSSTRYSRGYCNISCVRDHVDVA